MAFFTSPTLPRVLLAGLGLLGLLAGCQSNSSQTEQPEAGAGSPDSTRATAGAPAGGLYVRKNCNSPAAQADLQALAVAMDKMKHLGCDNPLSWYYQGAIHNVPDTIGSAGTQYRNPYCAAYTTGKPVLFAWDGCTHGSGENHFLLWHRLYTWHLERIVRKLSGKADFALPYWDYTNQAPGYRVMPAAFRAVGDSLYSVERYPPLNQGQPINSSMNVVLDTIPLFQSRLFSVFNTQLDDGIHGAMHDYIGCGNDTASLTWNRIYQRKLNGGMMGNVPSAGFDPIFWAHHSNIDYLWARWAQSARGQRPNLDSLKAGGWNNYNFIDENGKRVSYTVEQAYALALHPDYRYDNLPAPAVPAAKPSPELVLRTQGRPAQGGPATTLAAARVGRRVVAPTTFTVPLPVPAAQSRLLKSAVPPVAGSQPPRLLLRVEVSLTKEPRGYYALYVRNQGGAGALATPAHLAGTLNFFGVSHRHHGAGHDMGDMGGMAMPRQLTRTFIFDITDEVNAASFKQGLDVQVVPQSTSAVPITIEKVTLITQPL